MRVCAVNGTNSACGCSDFAAAQAEFLLGQHHDAAALGGFVGERRELRGVGEAFYFDAGRGNEIGGHAVAERDRAGLVEQQHVHVAGGFDGATACGHDVAADQAVNAADADGAQQPADGRRNQTHEQRDEHGHGEHDARVNAERFQCHADQQEDQRQRGKQNRQRYFVRRLLAFRAFDHRDHAVEEAVAFFRRDADDDAVADDARAAGDGAAVAAALADDRRGFAGDGGFVHARDAFDDFAVGGDHIVRLRRRRGRPFAIPARELFPRDHS